MTGCAGGADRRSISVADVSLCRSGRDDPQPTGDVLEGGDVDRGQAGDLSACIGSVASCQGASLDHTIWFHLRSQAAEWHWFDTHSYGLFGAHGLTTDDVL
jgi:hypothetical protein